MGKIKRIKAARKRAAVEQKLKKKRQKKQFAKLLAISCLLLAIGGGGYLGYKRYRNKQLTNNNQQEQTTNDQGRKTYDNPPEMQIDTAKKYEAIIETNKGNFKVELYADKAPKTVNNFVFLAREKFYDGLTFHRVIKDFMIQGGDPKGDGSGDPGYKFDDEQNDVQLVRGVLAMANSGPNTNGSQFFVITKEETNWLQGKHTAFGKVIEGLDVVMTLEEVETGENDKPKEDVVINKIVIEEK